MTDLSKGLVVVTGASAGLGRALSIEFASRGLRVAGFGRRAEELAETARLAGPSFVACPVDVSSAEEVNRSMDRLARDIAPVTILVNNAATNPYFGHITDTDLGAFQKTVDVNIRGYFFMCARGAKLMARQGGGSIINVASVNGVIPGMAQGIYSITKAAVISMTHAFAKECAPLKVRVNALLPGATDTKFASALTANEMILKTVLAHVPMNRVADPSEMAGAVLYLASDAASYTTGTCLNVDGGYLLA